jgi:hypothetical protein
MERATDAFGPRHRQALQIPHAHLPHGLVTFPRRILPRIEPWFLAYACLGVVQGVVSNAGVSHPAAPANEMAELRRCRSECPRGHDPRPWRR